MNFEDIQTIGDLESVSRDVIWQNFERLAGFILEKNDFRVAVNTVKTLRKKRRQYDVIAWKNNRTFLIECKKWAGSRYRLSALKKAIVQHKERSGFYRDVTGSDAVPLIVTLIEEEIHVYEGVPIIPILRLNGFISELDRYADGNSYCFTDDPDPLPDYETDGMRGDYSGLYEGESGEPGKY